MKFRSDATSWAFVLTAATSLVFMICLLQIDNIVHGTLYNYGLQFSYNWAGPYWRLTQICFALSWLNIIIAFAVQLNNIRMKNKAEQPATAIEKAWRTAKAETEKAPEESAKEHKDEEPTKPPEEAPKTAPEPETQEKKEEPQQPEETPEKEPQLPETTPDEIPTSSDLFQVLSPA